MKINEEGFWAPQVSSSAQALQIDGPEIESMIDKNGHQAAVGDRVSFYRSDSKWQKGSIVALYRKNNRVDIAVISPSPRTARPFHRYAEHFEVVNGIQEMTIGQLKKLIKEATE